MWRLRKKNMNTGIELNAKFWWIQWNLIFCSPRIKINGGQFQKRNWGKNFIPLAPGNYNIEVSIRYMFIHVGHSSIYLQIYDGEISRLKYRTPFFVFSGGTLVEIPNYNRINTQNNNSTSAPAYTGTSQNNQRPPQIKSTTKLPPIPNQREYYLVVSEEQVGPYDLGKVKLLIEIKQINQETLVWTEGLNEWKAASQFPEIDDLFNN